MVSVAKRRKGLTPLSHPFDEAVSTFLRRTQQPTNVQRSLFGRRQSGTPSLCIEAVGRALDTEHGDEVAEMIKDGYCDGSKVLFALTVRFAPAALRDLGNGGGKRGCVGDRARRKGSEGGGQLGLGALTEGEDDLADGRGVRDAGTAYKGR